MLGRLDVSVCRRSFPCRNLLKDCAAALGSQPTGIPAQPTLPVVTFQEETSSSNRSASTLVEQMMDDAEDGDDDDQYWENCDDMDMAEISETPILPSESLSVPGPSQTPHTATSRSCTPPYPDHRNSTHYPELKAKLKSKVSLLSRRLSQEPTSSDEHHHGKQRHIRAPQRRVHRCYPLGPAHDRPDGLAGEQVPRQGRIVEPGYRVVS
jgi:hypothetical protein